MRPAAAEGAAEVDLLLRGGTLVDGTGAPPRRADLAVKAGRIAAIGELAGTPAREVVDVSGHAVAPGFIDMHSHADLVLLAEPGARRRLVAAKAAQGVTTIVVGNCGLGPAPCDEAAAGILAAVNGWMTPEGVRTSGLTLGRYLELLGEGGVPFNVAALAPHGPIRVSAMGLSPGRPDAAQARAMARALDRALDEGAFGLSFGLIYPPGMYSDTDELVELARLVAARDRLVTAHVRGSSETLEAASRELIEIGRLSGARVHHSHLEAVGRRFWPGVRRVLALEDGARRDGVRVSHDVFPYTRAATMMSAIFPPWSLEGGVPALLERLADPATRERIRVDVECAVPGWPPWVEGGWPHNLVGAVGWGAILVASVGGDGPREWIGRSLGDIAAEAGRAPFDVVADLMIDQRGRVGQLVGEISGDPVELDPLLSILVHPAAAVITDAEDYGRGVPHPAHAGAFARALRLNRERRLMPLEALIRRMTLLPASIVGLTDRGVLRPGAPADVAVFDPVTVGDRATWDEPRATAAGMRLVLVNGRPTDSGDHGVVLRAA